MKSGSQLTLSLNWKPACAGSKSHHSFRLMANTIRLVHSAAQRALRATTASSPRIVMITRQPTIGSQVTSDRIGKPAAFAMVFINGTPGKW